LPELKYLGLRGDLNRDTIKYFCSLKERKNLYSDIFHKHISVMTKEFAVLQLMNVAILMKSIIMYMSSKNN